MGLWALTLVGLGAAGWLDVLLRRTGYPELAQMVGTGNATTLVAAVGAAGGAAGGHLAGRHRQRRRHALPVLHRLHPSAVPHRDAAVAPLVVEQSDGWLFQAALGISVAVLPLATGAAILRYRLYDIDRIVSRTLAYALLTVLLGLGYAAVALGLGRLLGQNSSLAVAAATLVVAAVFQPARRRIQTLVDRRFNRRRHDAGRVIEAFGGPPPRPGRPGTLTAEVIAVADQAMQPTTASLWLRPGQAGSAPARPRPGSG